MNSVSRLPWRAWPAFLATLPASCLCAQIITNTWIASPPTGTDADWSLGRLPIATDVIRLDGAVSSADLAWHAALPATVAGWVQEASYTGVVTFDTTYNEAFPVFTVDGDVALLGGTWTHHHNSNAETWRLKVSVNGDMTIGADASINVQDRGYATGSGPGHTTIDGWGGGTTFAGETCDYGRNVMFSTYGLIRTPASISSGARDYSGAGSVWLEVAGHLTLDGVVTANGSGRKNGGGGTAGGSVFVKAATLSGTGRLIANAGYDGWHGHGSGGRVALLATEESEIPATLSAQAFGNFDYDIPSSGAGTVYLATGANAETRGVVRVDNNNINGRYTHLPARRTADQTEDLSQTSWHLSRRGKVALQASATIAGMTLDNGTELNLYSHILTTDALSVNGTAHPLGVYTGTELGSQVYGNGFVNIGGWSIVTNGLPQLAGSDVELNGGVAAVNGVTSLLLFYGAEDGATDADAWEASLVITDDAMVGPISHTVTPTGSKIFYRYAVSNDVGIAWTKESPFLLLSDINVQTVAATADKSVPASGQFKITRPTEADNSLPVSVNISLAGTAVNGVDYTLVQSPVIIPAESDHAMINIMPIGKWNVDVMTVALTIEAGTYMIGTDNSASLDFAPIPVPSGHNAYFGGDASKPAAWSAGRLPVATDHILVAGWAIGSDLAWTVANNLPAMVANWTQTNYNNTVTIGTTYGEDFPVLTITGNAMLSSGKWDHLNNSGATKTHRLRVDVGGDFFLGSSAVIALNSVLWWSPWKGYQDGPGSYPYNSDGFGACHAGEGLNEGGGVSGLTYGRVLTPDELGSGNGSLNYGRPTAGAGAVWIEAKGTLTVNGVINISGNAQANAVRGGSSAGSVCLRAPAITGAGFVYANGGGDTWHGAGSGGRIALVSESAIPATLVCQAFGGPGNGNTGGSGTIFRGTDALSGSVVVDNGNRGNTYFTHLPARRVADQDEDLHLTDWLVTRNGKISLQADVRINSMTLDNSAATLKLNACTLTLFSFTDRDGNPFTTAGRYTDNDTGAFDNVDFTGGGAIVIASPATLFILR